jgi:hypothetical protein
MPLYAFQELYSKYCFKNGYKEVASIEEEVLILERFNLEIEAFEDKQEPAYVNIRFKTPTEKGESTLNISETEEKSIIDQFLQLDCQ